jgi:hypothetical protein
MARGAAIGVKTRAKAYPCFARNGARNRVDLLEPIFGRIKKAHFIRVQASQGATCARWTASNPRIMLGKCCPGKEQHRHSTG